jgi:hypothetical protein
MPARSITMIIPTKVIANDIVEIMVNIREESVQATSSNACLYNALMFEQLASSKSDLASRVEPNKS